MMPNHFVLFYQGEYAQVQALLEECLVLTREGGDDQGHAFALALLGLMLLSQGDLVRAQAHLEESLAMSRQEPVAIPTKVIVEPPIVPHIPKPPAHPKGLTAREMEVLHLLAQGLTSAQMAERLVIGLVTVNSHVRSIYSKLGVTSRAAATRYAIEHKLV